MNDLYFNVHGIKANLRTEDDKFTTFVATNYRFFSDTSEESQVEVYFDGYYSWPRRRKRISYGSLYRLNTGLYVGLDRLIWDDKRFSVTAQLTGNRLKISCRYYEHIEDLPRKVYLGPKRFRLENYQRIMRLILHFPIFWMLAVEEGKYLIHASAVEKNGKGLIFAGLNGVGKTTLALYLVKRRGYRFLSDNFLIFDKERIYAFPEVVRMSPKMAEWLKLKPCPYDTMIFGKGHYLLGKEEISREAVPEDIFFVYLGQGDVQIEEVPPSAMVDRIVKMHQYLGEFPEHSYLGALNFLEGTSVDWNRACETLSYMVRNCKCHFLMNTKGISLERITEEIEHATVDS